MKREMLAAVRAARQARQPIAVITDITTGDQRIVAREAAAHDEFSETLTKAFRFDASGVAQTPAGEVFITILNPPLRLVITGAVLIAQFLVPMARAAGYDISIIDPRGAFATAARFADVSLRADWPQDVMPKLALDSRSAFIALTHDPKIDDPALEIALASDVFYIGALGSRKTHGSRLERLKAKGFSEADLARIHGPIGLSIGAVGAAEISISIMAEITRALRVGV